MFHPRDMHRIAPLLAQAARDAGAWLIQAMQHETSACHFVLAKDDGREIGYFDPDCTDDYRKQGRLWLSAEQVLARRRRRKSVYVPAVADEFTYYLIKKVLKQSVTDFQVRRLRHLYQRDPAACREGILKFWSVATVRAAEKALVVSDLGRLQSHLPDLLAELKTSALMEGLGKRVAQRFEDGMRVILRVLRPTGMSVLVCDGEREQRSAIAEALLQQLSPGFRGVANLQLDVAGTSGRQASFRLALKILLARIRSTFVVSSAGGGKLFGSSRRPKWLDSLITRLLFRPDLIFVLTADDGQTFASTPNDVHSASATREGRVIFLDSRLSAQQNAQQATRAVLRCLATRQVKLLSPARCHPAGLHADPRADIVPEPAGLHLVVK